MDNIRVETDPARNIKPDKEKSTEKIDGAVALITALNRVIRNQGNNVRIYKLLHIENYGIMYILGNFILHKYHIIHE